MNKLWARGNWLIERELNGKGNTSKLNRKPSNKQYWIKTKLALCKRGRLIVSNREKSQENHAFTSKSLVFVFLLVHQWVFECSRGFLGKETHWLNWRLVDRVNIDLLFLGSRMHEQQVGGLRACAGDPRCRGPAFITRSYFSATNYPRSKVQTLSTALVTAPIKWDAW